MEKAKSANQGVTLVELMLAVVVASILASAVGALLVSANRALIRNSRQVEIQRDASLTMDTIGRYIRETAAGQISFAGGVLSIGTTNNHTIVWDQQQNTIVLNPQGMELVRNDWTIQDFTASQSPNGSWYVLLQLQDPQSGSLIVMPANFLPRN